MTTTLMVEADYLELAARLVRDSALEGTRFALECPEAYTLVLVCEHDDPVKALVAATLLKESWPYEWMVIGARILFRVAV